MKTGDLDESKYAYLFDRIKIHKGEKQRYGTQFANVDIENNNAELFPTENPDQLDQRRMEIGLMPIDVYRRLMLRSVIPD